MAKVDTIYKITQTKHRTGQTYEQVGTLAELIKAYSYTLEVGESWQHEKGNKKINRNPKTIETLVKNLDAAKTNAATNGYSGVSFTFEIINKIDNVVSQ